MAAFQLKLKTKDRNFELNTGLSSNTSLAELQCKISSETGIPISRLKVLSGYPKKQVNFSTPGNIQVVGIRSGETLFVEEDANSLPSVDTPVAIQSDTDNATTHGSLQHINNEEERAGLVGILLKKEVPSDNSCLFSSLEFVLSGKLTTSDSADMRQLVASVITSQPEEYNDAILGKPAHEYCKWILNPNSWGGGLELAILSNHFGFEIVVVNSTTGTISRFGEDKGYDQRVFLLFDGIHYDPLYMDFMTIAKVQTIFPTSDEGVLRDAEQLAKEAKDSRQYTDVNQFMICCKVCNSIFVGQIEAQAHAKKTGHTAFDEVQITS